MKTLKHSLKLPISLDDVLRGKSVEWERLEYSAVISQKAVETMGVTQLPTQSRDQVTQLVTQSVTQSDENIKRLIQAVGTGEFSPKVLRQKLGISHRTFFRNNYLNLALESGWLEPTIPDKPTSRNQKYRLTEKGRRALSQNQSETGAKQ